MALQVQYARTSDGVNIAYTTVGQGRPYVYVELPVAHFQREWNESAGSRHAFEFVARFRTFVRYDPRGFGLSDRTPADFSVETLVRDLEAVERTAGLSPFQLHAEQMVLPRRS